MGYLNILDTTRVIWRKFCIENPPIFGATIQNLFTQVTWPLEFVRCMVTSHGMKSLNC